MGLESVDVFEKSDSPMGALRDTRTQLAAQLDSSSQMIAADFLEVAVEGKP
jgi:hypothetical protein